MRLVQQLEEQTIVIAAEVLGDLSPQRQEAFAVRIGRLVQFIV